MKRLVVCFCIVLCSLSMFSCEKHQKTTDHYVVGIVSLNWHTDKVIEGFMAGMERRGYVEGENVTYIYPGPLANLSQVKQLIEELVVKKVNLIYTITTPVTKVAKELTLGTRIPVLFGPMMSPVGAGLVSDIYSSQNTITGVRVRGSIEKTLFFLKKIVPDLKNIYVPFHVGNGPAEFGMIDLKEAAQKLGVKIISQDVRSKQDLENALMEIPDEAEGIWISNSHMIVSMIPQIVEIANELKIPTASPLDQSSEGVLVTYAPKHIKIGEQLCRLADKLLRGVSPSSLPIETADFYLAINAKAADSLGVEIPITLLNQADFVMR